MMSPRFRPSLLASLSLLVGCAGSAPASNSKPAPTAPGASASASANGRVSTPATSASAANPPPSDVPPNSDDLVQDNLAGTIDRMPPVTAPCDFARSYRGTIGTSPFSVVLTRKDKKLEGFVAYDSGVGELNLLGTLVDGGKFSFEESKDGKAGGSFEGTCAASTGILSGTWKLGTKSQPFVLKPRPAGATPLAEKRRVIGPPADQEPMCNLDVQSPAVFGLGDAARAGRINAHLKIQFGGLSEAEAEKQVNSCPSGTENHVLAWYSVEMDQQAVLSVVENGYLYLGPAVHGDFNAAAAATSVDIPSGKKLALGDIVTSSKALRPVVHSCMKLVVDQIGSGDEWWFERDIQGMPADKNGEPVEETARDFDPKSVKEPSFLVLSDGLAVLIRNQPTVSAFLELQGVVIRWGALVRAGVLKSNSPISRVWANVKPLGANEPACTRYFEPKWTQMKKRAN